MGVQLRIGVGRLGVLDDLRALGAAHLAEPEQRLLAYLMWMRLAGQVAQSRRCGRVGVHRQRGQFGVEDVFGRRCRSGGREKRDADLRRDIVEPADLVRIADRAGGGKRAHLVDFPMADAKVDVKCVAGRLRRPLIVRVAPAVAL